MEEYWFKIRTAGNSVLMDELRQFTQDLAKFVERQASNKRALIIFIGGPSAVGKSSLALEMAHIMGIRAVISSDTIRLILANRGSDTDDQVFRHRSHETWKIVSSEYSTEALRQGFLEQCSYMQSALAYLVTNAIQQVQNTIIEGIHLLPHIEAGLSTRSGAVFISLNIDATDEKIVNTLIPMRCVSTYMNHSPEQYLGRLERILGLAAVWRDELHSAETEVIENMGTPDDLVLQTLRCIGLHLRKDFHHNNVPSVR